MSQSDSKIRPLRLGDVEAISFVNVTSYLETDRRSTNEQTNFDVQSHMAHNISRWRRVLEAIESGNGQENMLGAFNEIGDLQGFIRYGNNQKDESKAEIHALYIAPEHWGQGTGTQLFKQAARDMKDQGYDSLMVRTLRDDPLPNGFYRKMGFDLTPLFKKISGSREVVYEMDLTMLDI